MSEFRVTWGQRYAREAHPTFAKAHPDGWLTIVAPDEHAARDVAIDHLGAAWSFLYVTAELDAAWDEYFPRGELARIEAS